MIKKYVYNISFVLILGLIFPINAFAFTFGTVVSSHTTTSTTSLTLSSVVCSSGDILVVSLSYNGGSATSGVTYNSNALTQGVTHTSGSTAEVWYSLSPSAGTHNVVITTSSGKPINAGAVCISGADTTMIGATGSSNGTSASPNTSITTTVNNSVVIDAMYWNNYNTAVSSQDGTLLYHEDTAFDGEAGYGQYKVFSTAGSSNLAWSMAGSQAWVTSAIEILPSSSGGDDEEASSTLLEYSDPPSYLDWLFIVSLIIFFLSFPFFKSMFPSKTY